MVYLFFVSVSSKKGLARLASDDIKVEAVCVVTTNSTDFRGHHYQAGTAGGFFGRICRL